MFFKGKLGSIKDFTLQNPFEGNESIHLVNEELPTLEEIEEGRAMALLAYVPFLCFIPFLKGRNSNNFVYQHGKQGVLLFLFEIIVLLGAFFWKAALFIAAILAIVGIVYVIQGKKWSIPWIGSLAQYLDYEPNENEEYRSKK